MTVAAIVLVPAHAAWSGGALPIVIVSGEVAGPLAEAVADLPVTLARPEAHESPGIGWFVSGQRAAVAAVAETTAALLWPFRYAWVDPETVTSLVESHGIAPDAIVQPAYAGRPGFPVGDCLGGPF